MFDQIRVDNVREFYLMLSMQELHKELRGNQSISSYIRKHNLTISNLNPTGHFHFFACELAFTLALCFCVMLL